MGGYHWLSDSQFNRRGQNHLQARSFKGLETLFRSPWTPSIFEELGEIPEYLRIAWTALKPTVCTEQFIRAADVLLQEALDDANDAYNPSYGTGDLQQLGVALPDQAEVRTALLALLYGGSQTLLAIAALTQAIHGRPTGDPRAISWPRSQSTWSLEPVPMANERAGGEIERRVFAQARRTLDLNQTPRALRVIGLPL
ncbi:MAG TPA: halocarboxylic acid dehydrogenase DehI family protein [Chloroflexota bacterium]|nr:halocarboxylic acid dehydrogenase DehI family protein [Chloroflexota bacterium]